MTNSGVDGPPAIGAAITGTRKDSNMPLIVRTDVAGIRCGIDVPPTPYRERVTYQPVT
ncbi:hypothetical protein GCM10009675_19560 [Prauserella alba]|uniref:Uncharacterized protein n=1 Tax=Prauserella alba TaxID=176898 RepID=A0ABP4FWN8_9PSEU